MAFLYKITFFKNDISPTEWAHFFSTIFSSVSQVNLVITFQNTNIDFYISSGKKIDLLNSRLHPFYLTDEITDKEIKIATYSFEVFNPLLTFIHKNMLQFIEAENLRDKHIFRISFSLNKYNPFNKLPWVEIIRHTHANYYVKSMGLCINHLYSFLSFDLSRSIRSEIAKVKPVLATGSIHLSPDDTGILSLKGNMGDQSLSVRSYDFSRHSLILGQSGSGKSYLMKLLMEDIYSKYGQAYGIVLIDPHASLDPLLTQIPSKRSIDFKTIQTDLFVNIGQPVLSTELALDLFSTVLDISNNQDLQRILKFSLKLLFSINAMTLLNLRDILTDTLKRKELLKRTDDRTILQFFETEYQQLYTSKYDSAILPIINLTSEMDFINPEAAMVDLVEVMNDSFLVSIPVKQTDLGKGITKILGGAIIQQVFTIMQAGLVKKKMILVIDEFSVVQNPSLIHILSEARKFGLTVIFTQQYLMQVPLEMLQSIFANVVNYFCFKVARDDAEIIARNLNLEIDEYFLKNKNDPREKQELGVKLLTDLNPREVICRIMVDDHYINPFKSKTISITT